MDIFVISFLIFISLRVLHRNVHRRVLFVFCLIALLYVAAQTYQWHLTLRFLEVVAFSATVGCILVFQEDIRRFLESSLFVFTPSAVTREHSDHWIQVLTKSIDTFSKNRVGALIVLQQRISLSHHVRGGYRLNGDISFPLLCSIFDTHSVGHDGAVILKGARVSRFGVHLPLSRKHETTGRSGTRHAAALGISEITDALVIVVSEETGEIGLAQGGQFESLSLEQLESYLLKIGQSQQRENWKQRIYRYLSQTWAVTAASLGIAFGLWIILIAPSVTQQRVVSLSVSLEGVPSDLIFEEPQPQEFKVTLAGPSESFDAWSPQQRVVHVSAASFSAGVQSIPLSARNLSLPPRMRVVGFEPAQLKLTAFKTRKVMVPVVLHQVGRTPASGILRYRVHPKEVPLTIRKDDPGPSLISSEPVDFSMLRKGETLRLKLVPPPKTVLSLDSPQSVEVSLD